MGCFDNTRERFRLPFADSAFFTGGPAITPALGGPIGGGGAPDSLCSAFILASKFLSAFAVTNFQHEIELNEKRREIDVLKNSYINTFVNDLRDVVRYDKHSNYITSSLAATENTNVVNP